jgi:hypothetical protein
MPEKTTGYILLISGLILIGISAFSVYQVFTKQAPPINYFSLASISVNIPNASVVELMSGKTMSDSANLTIHIILMSFLVGVGSKIASLGIQLLRPIEVKLNTK